jgi:gamma-D-glutamyl-L-lysine dipeptidyl-peptidase
MNQQFGVCNLALVPLRTDPSDRSEMCSQLLFGDCFIILEVGEKWSRVICSYDDYEGWIDNKQYVRINNNIHTSLSKLNTILGLSVIHPIFKADTSEMLNLLAGTIIPEYLDNYFDLGDVRYRLESRLHRPNKDEFRSGVYQVAMFYLNAPYLWGGRSIFGIDCSGFTQMVFRQFGIRLKRDAWQQAEQGELLGFIQEARAGDLAFFDNDEGRITHVGIMLDNNRIIHASGMVRIDVIDNQGIFNRELNKYTHKLRIVKRFN